MLGNSIRLDRRLGSRDESAGDVVDQPVDFEWYTIHIAKHEARSMGSKVHDFAKLD